MNSVTANSFSDKFFKFYPDQTGELMPYSDGLGAGAYADWRHILWIVATPVLGYLLYQFFKSRKELGKTAVLTAAISLLILRIGFQLSNITFAGHEPAWRFIPFHLCAIMGFVMPVVAIFQIEKLKMPIYVIGMMGGIATVAFGDYFVSSFLAFEYVEGIIAHTLLIFIPIIEISIGRFKLEIKKSWPIFVVMPVLILWAFIGNQVFFKSQGTNYMFLNESGFPNGFGGSYYFAIYVLLFFLVYIAIFIPPEIYRKKTANK